MNDFLSFIENKIKKNIKVEKILISDNSNQHKNTDLLILKNII